MAQRKGEIYFRLPGGKKARRGTIIEAQGDGYLVQGRRTASQFNAPVYFVPRDSIWSKAAQSARYKRRNRDFDAECRRRAEIGSERLDISEENVLTHPAVLNMAMSVLSLLARQNDLDSDYTIKGGILHNRDHDAMELYSEYALALIIAFRREAAQAPQADLDEFREHLRGKRHDSRIFATITFAGRGAAIRAVKRMNICRDIQFDTVGDGHLDGDQQDIAASVATAPYTESDAFAWAQMKHELAVALLQLRHTDLPGARILMAKYALGAARLVPMSNDALACLLNKRNIPPPECGRKVWTRNLVSTRVKAALDALKQGAGLAELWREGRAI